MSRGTDRSSAAVVQRLMKQYEIYDQAVDVVSAFEFLFTKPPDMAATVAHFERFPKIRLSMNADPVTPDFTVLFTDRTALVGEVARLALHDQSVEDTCAQILRYDQLTHVPDVGGHLTPVTDVSIAQFVPLDIGPDAVDRIIYDRMLNQNHSYKPSKPPCIVQFARDPDRYMFQRINDRENGHIDGHGREPHIGPRIRKINVPASGFTGIKATSKFMNDPIPALYLAVILYTQTWPSIQRGQTGPIIVNPADTAQVLQAQYRSGTADEVRNAIHLLASAGLAAENGNGTWAVAKPPRVKGEHDLARIIAQRSADQAKPIIRSGRTISALSSQLTLFD